MIYLLVGWASFLIGLVVGAQWCASTKTRRAKDGHRRRRSDNPS